MPVIGAYHTDTYADIASFAAKQSEDIGLKVAELRGWYEEELLLGQERPNKRALFFRGGWMAVGVAPRCRELYGVFLRAAPNYTRYSNPPRF